MYARVVTQSLIHYKSEVWNATAYCADIFETVANNPMWTKARSCCTYPLPTQACIFCPNLTDHLKRD